MLADDLLWTIDYRQRNVGATRSGMDRAIRRLLSVAQRFVLSPLCVETAAQLADQAAIERTRSHLFTPARLTWLEWAGETPGGIPTNARHGVLLIGEGEGSDQIKRGWGIYAVDWLRQIGGDRRRLVVPVPVLWDFPDRSQPLLRWGASPLGLPSAASEIVAGLMAVDMSRLGAFIGAGLALINTPRLSERVDCDMVSVNRTRSLAGRPTVLSYTEVKIRIDRGALGVGVPRLETGGRAYHHVRAFLRLARGRVQLVSPHWRGNPRFGIIRHRYVALREEDEAGPWQGGPLPPPQILRRPEPPEE